MHGGGWLHRFEGNKRSMRLTRYMQSRVPVERLLADIVGFAAWFRAGFPAGASRRERGRFGN